MGAPAEGVFAALADPTRWRVLNLLAERGEGTATSLAGELPVSRVAVVKHLAVLDRAGLVEGRRQGREVRYAVRPERLDAATQGMARVSAQWDERLAAIKRLAEASTRE
jgi:DNA-binding transcriptional ArsR family regulator